MTENARQFIAANTLSPVVAGSTIGAGGQGCHYMLKDGSTFTLGDERSVDVELREAENVLRAHQHYDLAQTVSEARAALVRSPIGDDVREAIQFALDELKPMPRLLSQWAGGMGKQITAVRTRLRKATTAIGSQSIEGERAPIRYAKPDGRIG